MFTPETLLIVAAVLLIVIGLLRWAFPAGQYQGPTVQRSNHGLPSTSPLHLHTRENTRRRRQLEAGHIHLN